MLPPSTWIASWFLSRLIDDRMNWHIRAYSCATHLWLCKNAASPRTCRWTELYWDDLVARALLTRGLFPESATSSSFAFEFAWRRQAHLVVCVLLVWLLKCGPCLLFFRRSTSTPLVHSSQNTAAAPDWSHSASTYPRSRPHASPQLFAAFV